MSINGVNSLSSRLHCDAMNMVNILVGVNQNVESAKSQSITLDNNRQCQDINNQVKDDQDAISQQSQESKKQKRRDRRHKIFGWIFHPLKSATKAIVQHHSNKTGKKPKEHPVLQKMRPLALVNTLLHPRKAIRKVATKFSHPVASMKKMLKPRENNGLALEKAKNIGGKTGIESMGEHMFRLHRINSSLQHSVKLASFSDTTDAFINGLQISKIHNNINALKNDEQMWNNLEDMSKNDSEYDQQQLSSILRDDASNAKSIVAMLNSANKYKSSIVSNIAGHA